MGKRIDLKDIYRPKRGSVGRKLAVSSRGSDIATDSAKIAGCSAKKGTGARTAGEAGSNPARSTIITNHDELKAAMIAAGIATEEDFASKPYFDRKRYQRDYMRDRTQAKKLGLTVSEYRKQKEAKA